mmetsp:Transcript_54328/g.101862  ORF Transcript_54328/g.101862 Transcript_54328/m.101862 type:complete len:168 (-) Transcript_54328:182-685(-)
MTESRLPPSKPGPGLEEWRQRLEAAFRRTATAPALSSLVPESTRASSCSGFDASSACDQLDESPLPEAVCHGQGTTQASNVQAAFQWEEDFRSALLQLDLERLEHEQQLQAQQLEALERQRGTSRELQDCRETMLALRQANEQLREEIASVTRPPLGSEEAAGCCLF